MRKMVLNYGLQEGVFEGHNAAEATTFVQEPETFDESCKGMGGETCGVVGMLEVIQSDVVPAETGTEASEASARKEYDEFMTDSQVAKTKKSIDIQHKPAKQAFRLNLQPKLGVLHGHYKYRAC